MSSTPDTTLFLDHFVVPLIRDQTGGLSGLPVRARSMATLRTIRQHTTLPVIACGGISDEVSARDRLEAGADLLQVYTAFIYQGPGLLGRLS